MWTTGKGKILFGGVLKMACSVVIPVMPANENEARS